MINLVKIESEDKSHEILEKMRGRKFFSVVYHASGKVEFHKNKMSDEEIIYCSNLLINKILNEVD